MINTLEELLQDYASYSLNLDLIDEKQRQALDEKSENYIKQLNQLNLLGIDVVRASSDSDAEHYWRERCELAEKYIEESPCDPDIYQDQHQAFIQWTDFKKNLP